jgi:hypothetical protein
MKQLTVTSLVTIAHVLALKGQFVEDAQLRREMAPRWKSRDAIKAHAHRRAPIGPVTLRRVRPAVLSELGREGARARNAKLGPETRRALAQAAARARWQNR